METEKRKTNPPEIPIDPMTNMIIVERIEVQSKIEKRQREKNPDLILSKEQIAKMNQEAVQVTGNILDAWDEHPMQGVIVAIDEKVADINNLRVGDKVAWRVRSDVGEALIFNKKKYVGLYPHDLLCRYLTNKV